MSLHLPQRLILAFFALLLPVFVAHAQSTESTEAASAAALDDHPDDDANAGGGDDR